MAEETKSKRSSSSDVPPASATSQAVEQFGGEPVDNYDDALEAGYFGGPVDTEDHTVAGEIARAEKAKKESGK
jgi:hypothetical protein